MRKNTIFIPMSVEQKTTAKSNYFLSGQKGVLIALGLIPSALWIPYVSSLTKGEATGMVLALASYVVMFVIYMRLIVLEEVTWKKLFKNLEKNKISTHNHFWGVDRTDEKGIIHYKYSGSSTIKKGVVIKLIRGSKIGKDLDYEEEYRETFRRILGELLKEGLKFEVRTLEDDKTTPKSVLSFYEKVKNIEDPGTRSIAMEHIKNLAITTRDRKTLEVIYITVYFHNPTKFKDIISISQRVVKMVNSSKFFKMCNILNKFEVEKYIARTLCINTFPKERERIEVRNFNEYGEIYRVFDEHGNEEYIEGGFDLEDEIIKEEIKELELELDIDINEKNKSIEDIYNDMFEDEIYESTEKRRHINIDIDTDIDDTEDEVEHTGEVSIAKSAEDKKKELMKQIRNTKSEKNNKIDRITSESRSEKLENQKIEEMVTREQKKEMLKKSDRDNIEI